MIDKIVKFPEKEEMRQISDWPPQLETPLRVLKKDFTPNDYFFVRWHMADMLFNIDIDTFRLYIGGAVQKPVALSMTDLMTKFPVDSIAAVAVCAGNNRSSFEPKVKGLQWRKGAVGNAMWKGVKLKHLLEYAGIKFGAVDVSFQGMEKGTLPSIPAFVRSLPADRAMDGEVLIAYEMNGAPLPMLNGYPLKLVVPGWYASYWVGALNTISVLDRKFEGFWMDKAYLAPANDKWQESPDNLTEHRKPLAGLNLFSFFITPEAGDEVVVNSPCELEGLVYNDGTPIRKVEVSVDNGKTWKAATLQPVLGKYAWRRWKYDWRPNRAGSYVLKVKATDSKGRTQQETQWNRNGYARGFIEAITINAK